MKYNDDVHINKNSLESNDRASKVNQGSKTFAEAMECLRLLSDKYVYYKAVLLISKQITNHLIVSVSSS